MIHVVKFSGGMGSWAAAKRVAARHGTADLILLFTDTLAEDSDLYRFLIEGAANIFGVTVPEHILRAARAVPEWHEDRIGRRAILAYLRDAVRPVMPNLVWIAEGRDPWEVFRDERFLGNSRVDPCSKILKRQLADRWLNENCDRSSTTLYIGIDWTEEHRFDDKLHPGKGAKHRWAKAGWTAEAPLCDAPLITKGGVEALLALDGIEPPRLNREGYAHNNCSGFCCKAGQGHYAHRLAVHPERFAFDEERELELIDLVGQPVSMLTDRRGDGKKKPLPLYQLRARIEGGGKVDKFEIGGCGCFLDDDPDVPGEFADEAGWLEFLLS